MIVGSLFWKSCRPTILQPVLQTGTGSEGVSRKLSWNNLSWNCKTHGQNYNVTNCDDIMTPIVEVIGSRNRRQLMTHLWHDYDMAHDATFKPNNSMTEMF